MADIPADMEPAFGRVWHQTRAYTMTSVERAYALWQATRYVARNRIPGAFVECGVWRGGSVMAMALTLVSEGFTDREFYLYDTFEGMPAPTAVDRDILGRPAEALLGAEKISLDSHMWGWSPVEQVRANLSRLPYPEERFRLVRGKVEDTIPAVTPDQIAFLRLDTDFYESTAHELRWLYPRLATGGVLLIDDYGHWQGARRAVDEFLEHETMLLPTRIDYTGRLVVKLPSL